jgi:hypothetical protein
MPIDFLKRYLKRKGKRVSRLSAKADLMSFTSLIRDQYVHVELVRIGGDNDGGYLMPNDFDGVRHCFSPGVDVKASFEEHLAQIHGIKSFLVDASVEGPPPSDVAFDFEKKFLGSLSEGEFATLGDWVGRKPVVEDDNDMVLQMDIEGGEFDVLIETSTQLLRRFRMIGIEFHGMEGVFDSRVLPLFRSIFQKLSQDFQIVHLHQNNYCKTETLYGIKVPSVFEVTFLRKDRVARLQRDGPIQLPHPRDQPNSPKKPDVVMPDIWWKQ